VLDGLTCQVESTRDGEDGVERPGLSAPGCGVFLSGGLGLGPSIAAATDRRLEQRVMLIVV